MLAGLYVFTKAAYPTPRPAKKTAAATPTKMYLLVILCSVQPIAYNIKTRLSAMIFRSDIFVSISI